MNTKSVKIFRRILFYILVLAFVVLLLLPFIWQFLTSVKPLNEIAAIPAKWIPSEINIQYYFNVFQTSFWKISDEQFYCGISYNIT